MLVYFLISNTSLISTYYTNSMPNHLLIGKNRSFNIWPTVLFKSYNLPLKVYTGSSIVLNDQSFPGAISVMELNKLCFIRISGSLWYVNSSLQHNLPGHTPYPCGILVVVVSQGVLYVNKLQSWVLSLASNCGDKILPYSCSFTLVASVKAFRLHNNQC